MQVFKTYFKIMKKQLSTILLYGLMFLGINIILTYAVFNKENNTPQFKTSKVPVLFVNEDQESSLISNFKEYLGKYVTFETIKEGERARKDALFSRKVFYILTIPQGFTEDMLAGREVLLSKEIVPDSADAISVDTVINNYLNTARLYVKYFPGSTMEELNTHINSTMAEDTPVFIDAKQNKSDLVSWAFNSYYYNYLGYIMITCFILAVSNVMLSFHGIDIRRKHFASPLTSKSYNAQLIIANLVFVMCYLLVFMVVGFLCNPNRKLDLNLLLTWGNVILFAMTVLSISYLIGITVKAKNAVQALSTMLSLSLAFLSGMFVPQQFLGEPVLKVASFTPAYWYVKANNSISALTNFNFESLSDILICMVIQLGFAVAIISIALVVSKRKRQQAI